MQIILGKENTGCFHGKPAKENTLHKSETVLIRSSNSAKMINLNEGRKLLFQGELYSITQTNGDQLLVDFATNGSTHIKSLFDNCKLSDAIDRIEGDFIGLLIESDNEIAIFGDVFNRTEVFYAEIKDGLILSTDLEIIIREKDEVQYDQVSLANLLGVYGYFAPKKHTIYKGIKRLGVGQSISWQGDKYVLEQKAFLPRTIEEFTIPDHERYANALIASVKKRASNNSNWICLSSGWDSTSILAILVELYGTSKVNAVIGEMRYSERSGIINQFEIDRAKKFADYYKVPLEVIPFDLRSSDSVDYWQTLAKSLKKNHIYSFVAYNFSRIFDHIHQNNSQLSAVFAGEISDAVHNMGFSQFATILEHPDISFREYSDKMASYLYGPSFFNRIQNGDYKSDAVYQLLKSRYGQARFDDEIDLSRRQRLSHFFKSFFLRSARIPFYSQSNSQLFTEKASTEIDNEFGGQYLNEAIEKATSETIYSWLIYLYNSFYWQGSNVRSFGIRYHENGTRLKLPYWDGQIHEILSSMPEYCGRGLDLNPTKYPLKWALKNKINYPMHLQVGPHSYLYDVNPEFNLANETLFASKLSDYFKNILRGKPYKSILSEEFFNLKYIDRLVDDYLDGVEFGGSRRNDLTSLVIFCLVGWY